MVSFSVSVFYSCWAWTCNYRPLVEKMVMKRHWQGIFHRSESGEESMGNKQWDCLYKNLRALLYGVSVWKLFFIRKSIHSEPSIVLFHSLTVRKKKERKKQTQNLGSFSDIFWWATQWTSLNCNPPLDHKWQFRNWSLWIIHETVNFDILNIVFENRRTEQETCSGHY